MCGIAGCLIGQGADEKRLQTIREIFQENLLANELRGKEATGVVACQHNGSYAYQKAALPACEFVRQDNFQDFLTSEITSETVILLGHTRDPTKGTVANNDNNHPIIVGETVGVHNGVISNDDSIFIRLNHGELSQARIGSVDSEAIFALLDQVNTNQPLEEYARGLQKATSHLVGSFTTLFFSKKIPSTLFCLRYDNPISTHYDQDLNCLFFSSRYVFLRKTFGRAVISKGMPARTGFIFEAQKIKNQGKTPSLAFALSQN
ncbi:MAG: hypothetical protein ABFS09_12430 [Thermodesulfobacteriota bacterium]